MVLSPIFLVVVNGDITVGKCVLLLMMARTDGKMNWTRHATYMINAFVRHAQTPKEGNAIQIWLI